MEFGDTGPGISSKVMHNIFNPYYTTKPRGTGLGLPITNRIIKAHKGKIELRNKDGGGAVFTIKLPCPKRPKRRLEQRVYGNIIESRTAGGPST